MKILIDMDDVMIDFLKLLVEEISIRYYCGAGKKYCEIKNWDLEKEYGGALTKAEIFSPVKNKRFWELMEPKKGAVEYIQRLIQDEHEIFVVTAAHPDTVKFRVKYVMEKYFPFIPIENLIITSKKQMVQGDILIDDNPNNLLGGDYFGMLMHAPHNKDFGCTFPPFSNISLLRVHDWEEVYQLIKVIEEW